MELAARSDRTCIKILNTLARKVAVSRLHKLSAVSYTHLIGNFHQGYASVCLNKLWGAIDLQNRVVVPLEWQGVAPIVNPQLLWVKKDNLYYLYDGVQKLSLIHI